MNKEQVTQFERVQAQLRILYIEMSLLSKKKEDNPINKFKLKFINSLLNEINIVLGDAYLPFRQFQQFDEDALPTNSDVVMMLAQYEGALDRFKSAHTFYDMVEHARFWNPDEGNEPTKVDQDFFD